MKLKEFRKIAKKLHPPDAALLIKHAEQDEEDLRYYRNELSNAVDRAQGCHHVWQQEYQQNDHLRKAVSKLLDILELASFEDKSVTVPMFAEVKEHMDEVGRLEKGEETKQ